MTQSLPASNELARIGALTPWCCRNRWQRCDMVPPSPAVYSLMLSEAIKTLTLTDCPRVTQSLCCHCSKILRSELQTLGAGVSVVTW